MEDSRGARIKFVKKLKAYLTILPGDKGKVQCVPLEDNAGRTRKHPPPTLLAPASCLGAATGIHRIPAMC
jgi:hypothetical protein